MALTDKLTAIADGFRLSRGTSKKYSLDDMAILAAENIVASSDGSPIVVENNISLSASVSITSGQYYTHFLYNGVRLPRIPFDVPENYPYLFIRKDTTNGNYDLYCSVGVPFYSADNNIQFSNSTERRRYKITISSAETATSWESNGTSTANVGINDSRPILWTNHDIPKGSATATDIYFAGSEPVPTD